MSTSCIKCKVSESISKVLVMSSTSETNKSYVIGPNGEPLTLADLPKNGNGRWVIRRKAEVLYAVRGGLLTVDEACERYNLTLEEFLGWQACVDKYGLAGLRTTLTQNYRTHNEKRF